MVNAVLRQFSCRIAAIVSYRRFDQRTLKFGRDDPQGIMQVWL